MVIKNIPTLVGPDVDVVDLKDETVLASADTVSAISGHDVETDDTSVSGASPN